MSKAEPLIPETRALIRALPLIALGVGAEIGEIGVIGLFYTRFVFLAFLLHLLIVAGIVAWMFTQRRRHRRRRLGTLLALSTFAFGLFGPLGTLVTIYSLWIGQRTATPFEAWYDSLFPKLSQDGPSALYRRLVRGGDAITGSVAPFSDILSGNNISEKQSVITLIAENFRPDYAPALRQALIDTEPAIRVQAATAMATIENNFLERAIVVETYAQSNPDDIDAAIALAKHLDDYAFSDLLGTERAEDNRLRALALYEEINARREGDPEIVHRIGRVLIHLGRLQEASLVYETLDDIAPNYLPAISWRLEILFQRRQWDELRVFAKTHYMKLIGDLNTPVAIRDALTLWSAQEQEAA